jgi:hypothetical protein
MVRIRPTEVWQLRSNIVRNVRRAPIVGWLVGLLLDVGVFFPMRLWAQLGLLRRRDAMPRRDADGGLGTAGVGARLPVIPPSKSGAARRELPRGDPSDQSSANNPL